MTDNRALWELVEKWRENAYADTGSAAFNHWINFGRSSCADELSAVLDPTSSGMNELVQQLRGRAEYLRDMKRVKSPQLMEQAADMIESMVRGKS